MTFSIFVTIYVRKLFGYQWCVVRAMTASTNFQRLFFLDSAASVFNVAHK